MLGEGCNAVFSDGDHVMRALRVEQNKIESCCVRMGLEQYLAVCVAVIRGTIQEMTVACFKRLRQPLTFNFLP